MARVGGDEFAIILDKCARKFVDAMLTREMGSAAHWVAAADKACYEAKSQGRGQIRVAGI